jgi:hypothetical protein
MLFDVVWWKSYFRIIFCYGWSCCVILIRAPFCWKDMDLYTKLSHVSTRVFSTTWWMNNRQHDPHTHHSHTPGRLFILNIKFCLFVLSVALCLSCLCRVLSCHVVSWHFATQARSWCMMQESHNTTQFVCLFVLTDNEVGCLLCAHYSNAGRSSEADYGNVSDIMVGWIFCSLQEQGRVKGIEGIGYLSIIKP